MKSLKAFTLMEVIIVMILTAILIAMSYSLYTTFQLAYLRYQKSSESKAKLLITDEAMRIDIKKASNVYVYRDSSQTIYFDEGNRRVRYSFTTRGIIRYSGEIDTLLLSPSNMTIALVDSNCGLSSCAIKKFSLEIRFDAYQINLSYHIDYPAQFYFRN